MKQVVRLLLCGSSEKVHTYGTMPFTLCICMAYVFQTVWMYVTISFCFYVCTVCTYGTNPSNCVYILHYSLKLYIIHMALLLQNCMRMCGQMVSKPCIYCTVHSKPLNCISMHVHGLHICACVAICLQNWVCVCVAILFKLCSMPSKLCVCMFGSVPSNYCVSTL